jgi:hypothetical protein
MGKDGCEWMYVDVWMMMDGCENGDILFAAPSAVAGGCGACTLHASRQRFAGERIPRRTIVVDPCLAGNKDYIGMLVSSLA